MLASLPLAQVGEGVRSAAPRDCRAIAYPSPSFDEGRAKSDPSLRNYRPQGERDQDLYNASNRFP